MNQRKRLSQDNYEMMFGDPEVSTVPQSEVVGEFNPITIRHDLVGKAFEKARKKKSWVLVFVIGTKPCFYKFWGSVEAAEAAGIPYIVVDSGQHYDPLLTFGAEELGYVDRIAVQLAIRGGLAKKSGELYFKTTYLAQEFRKRWPDVTAVPVVLGDTILTTIVPGAWLFARNERSIQNEAGLRSMAPDVLWKMGGGKLKLSPEKFIQEQFKGSWSRLTNEPFPEQYDTFTSAAGSEFHFAPIKLNADHLIEEGYDPGNIFTIGGVVVDAFELKKKAKPRKSIFKVYPQLAKGQWIRVDIHRRENLTPKRFAAIVGCVEKLVQKGRQVNFIEMNATRFAIDQYGLRKRLMRLTKKKNFLLTPIWEEWATVLEFYRSKHCFAALTDSGGLQEELNLIGKPGMTCRFNTDRPETVNEARGNILVPPISDGFMVAMIEHLYKSPRLVQSMAGARKLYGSKPGEKMIGHIEKLIKAKRRPFRWSHERLGFWQEDPTKDKLL